MPSSLVNTFGENALFITRNKSKTKNKTLTSTNSEMKHNLKHFW